MTGTRESLERSRSMVVRCRDLLQSSRRLIEASHMMITHSDRRIPVRGFEPSELPRLAPADDGPSDYQSGRAEMERVRLRSQQLREDAARLRNKSRELLTRTTS